MTAKQLINLMTKIDLSIPEAQWITSKVKSKRSIPREIIIKLKKRRLLQEKQRGKSNTLLKVVWKLSEAKSVTSRPELSLNFTMHLSAYTLVLYTSEISHRGHFNNNNPNSPIQGTTIQSNLKATTEKEIQFYRLRKKKTQSPSNWWNVLSSCRYILSVTHMKGATWICQQLKDGG